MKNIEDQSVIKSILYKGIILVSHFSYNRMVVINRIIYQIVNTCYNPLCFNIVDQK